MFGIPKDAQGNDAFPPTLRYIGQELYGPKWDPVLPALAQKGILEHLKYWGEQMDNGNVLLAGPLANFEYAFIVFSGQVQSYDQAQLILEGDPWAGTSQVVSVLQAWVTNPLAPA